MPTPEATFKRDGSPQVRVAGRQITTEDAVRLDVAIDRGGHVAYAESPREVTRSRLVVDGEVVGDDGALVEPRPPAFSEGDLLDFWLALGRAAGG